MPWVTCGGKYLKQTIQKIRQGNITILYFGVGLQSQRECRCHACDQLSMLTFKRRIYINRIKKKLA